MLFFVFVFVFRKNTKFSSALNPVVIFNLSIMHLVNTLRSKGVVDISTHCALLCAVYFQPQCCQHLKWLLAPRPLDIIVIILGNLGRGGVLLERRIKFLMKKKISSYCRRYWKQNLCNWLRNSRFSLKEENEIKTETYKRGCGDYYHFNCDISVIYQLDMQGHS